MPVIPVTVVEHLAAAGFPIEPRSAQAVGGGSINRSYTLRGKDGRQFFLKTQAPESLPMFEAEREGLEELAAARAVRVPKPLLAGHTPEAAFLLLEFLDLHAGSPAAAAALGTALAAQHRHFGEAFGWQRDNTIGSTRQPNSWMDDWTAFVGERRLGFQLRLAVAAGFGRELRERGRRLLAQLPVFFDGHPAPSLLHGDLWGGNWAMMPAGEPVIFDPAVYYGDRETDIAMTRLFGGFPREFYVAYEQAWPLDPGHERRTDVYNLYHVLNHLNLFGGSYLAEAVRLIDNLLDVNL